MTSQNSKEQNTLHQEEEPLPTSPEDLFKIFEDLGISYELHEHERVFTVEESAHLFDKIEGLHCRNLFVRDKKQKMF